MTRWPRDNQAELIAFYGEPGPDVERWLVNVVPPWPMFYGEKRIKSIKFHAKAAPALRRVFDRIWNYYGRSDAVIDQLDLEHYDGAYNPRFVRGSNSKWSNHAFAAALDINAKANGFGTGHGTMPLPVVAAFKSEGFRWGGDYRGRTDPMHFEACASGEPERTFEQWLAHYGCPPSYRPKDHPTVPLPRPRPQIPPDVEPTGPEPAPRPTQPDDPGPPAEPPKRLPWWRRWIRQIVGGSLIGGGITVGGVTIDGETLWALGGVLAIIGLLFLAYVWAIPPIGKIRKGW